jgi:hypothetical protein
MANKWVDKREYFGPDRRRRGPSKRWGDRRRDDEAGELPPLGALLRRLRVQMLGLSTAADQHRALQLLSAAIGEANRRGFRHCGAALQAAESLLRAGGDSSAIEAKIAAALDHAGAGR